MGFISDILNVLGEGESSKEREKRIKDKLFEDELNASGLDKWEREDCKRSGITPEEYAEENDPDYED